MHIGVIDVLGFLLGLALGAVLAWLWLKTRLNRADAAGFARGDADRATLAERAARVPALEASNERFAGEAAAARTEAAALARQIESERAHAGEKLLLLEQAKQQLSDQFKALAGEILEEKSRKFTEQNQTQLGHLLDPLRLQLADFKAKVEEVYVNEGKDRSALGEQVRNLHAMNQTLSAEANNLTLALTGRSKTQGNWGEIILDDVLERAGLVRGQHYDRQASLRSEDGVGRDIPDVIVRLPGDRQLVIDSKLTLPDYRAFAAAGSEDERGVALKRHLHSIRTHVKGLSDKNYQSLHQLSSLDCVVMFVPLEPAFMLAVTHDRELFHDAWDRNVLLTSPSTLLFVIRTVAHLWNQDAIGRNARDISSRGALLYDKLAGFVTDLEKVGTRLAQAQDSFDEAKRKLSVGKGSALRQAEMLRELGVKPTRALPGDWTEARDALEEGDEVGEVD